MFTLLGQGVQTHGSLRLHVTSDNIFYSTANNLKLHFKHIQYPWSGCEIVKSRNIKILLATSRKKDFIKNK